MGMTWNPGDEPPVRRVGPLGVVVGLLRGAVLGGVTYGGLGVLLVVRLIEGPIFGAARPISPHITQAVCRAAFPILGMRYRVRGRPMREKGAIVANHASWLDIFALNAAERIYFVAKSEVHGWPGIGWLARATGTLFIERNRHRAKTQQSQFEDRIRAGHRLLFFPEGTSTDGLRVLSFKSTLFAAFYSHGLDQIMHVQPVAVIYRAPDGQDPRAYGWWGDMAFGGHFWQVLTALRQGSVEIVFLEPVSVEAFPSRKDLARICEERVRAALEEALGETAGD